LPGVAKVQVDLAQDTFTVAYDDTLLGIPQMLTSIEALGYTPTVLQSNLPLSTRTAMDLMPPQVQALVDNQTPIVVYFGAPWCGACKIMERTTFAAKTVADALAHFHYLKVDVDVSADIAAVYGVVAVPTVLVLSQVGGEVYRHVGPLTAAEMVMVLEEFGAEKR
jgi:thiol:disulfide interchange protein